ncbi:MAG: hypothetical protein JNN30_20015 [Rhodanobacteraceae bacterium]|nr:hypothetical protein [Rhodanobacteraceae bacterium]
MDFSKYFAALAIAAASLLPTLSSANAPATSLVGTLMGTFDVSSTGGATYAIAIEVPPGRNGMQPELSLSYNSHQSDGFLGTGWDITGFPVIERCPATVYQDGRAGVVSYTDQDRFCLSGQRMIALQGVGDGGDKTEYRLEIDNQMKIVSYGNCASRATPCHFKAWTKSGEILRFGYEPDARSPGRIAALPSRGWALDKVIGRNGNHMLYRYISDAGTLYPNEIRYGGHEDANAATGEPRFVRFTRERRNDIAFSYGTARSEIQYRVNAISTYVGSQLVKQYRLAYKESPYTRRSMLSQISDCYSDQGSGTCLPPTRLTYSEEDGRVVEDQNDGYGRQTDRIWFFGRTTWMVDLNKDGLPENIVLSDNKHLYVLTNRGGRYCSDCSSADTDWGRIASGTIAESARSAWFSDMNDDGFPDFVYRDDDRQIRMVENVAGSRFGADTVLFRLPQSAPIDAQNEWLVDVNLDGRMDYMWITEDYPLDKVHVAIRRDSSYEQRAYGSVSISRDRTWLADMNGDGLQDIVYREGGKLVVVIHEEGRGFFQNYFPLTWNENFTLGEPVKPYASEWLFDVNGDGATDYVYKDRIRNQDGSYSLRVAYGGFRTNPFYPEPSNFPLSLPYVASFTEFARIPDINAGDLSEKSQWWGDLNGDSYVDYAYIDRDKNYRIGHNQNGRLLAIANTQGKVNGNRAWDGDVQWLVDLDGDAIADHLYLEDGSRVIRGIKSSGEKADLLTQIRDGLGAEQTIQYRSLSQPGGGFYSVGRNRYPYADAAAPMHVVSGHSDYDPASQLVQQRSYWYAEGITDLRGRGWLGFKYRYSRDPKTGIRSAQTMEVEFPLSGTTTQEILLRESDGAILNEATHLYAAPTPYSNKGIYRPEKRYLTVSQYNPGDNTPHHQTQFEYGYDSYGNVNRVTDRGDLAITGDETSVCQNIVNDPAAWVIGRVVDIKNVRATACGTFTRWDSAKDLSWLHNTHDAKENVVVECEWIAGRPGDSSAPIAGCPSTPDGQWRHVTHQYDLFGNLLASVDPLGRATTLAYDQESNIFVARNTLADGSERLFTNEPGFGHVLSTTDGNGVVSGTAYDAFGRAIESYGQNTTGQQVLLSTQEYVARDNSAGMAILSRARLRWDEDDPAGWAWGRLTTDAHGRTLREESKADAGQILTKDYGYNENGQLLWQSQPYFLGQATPAGRTRLEYDWAGRLIRTVSPLEVSTTTNYRLTRWQGMAVLEVTEAWPGPNGIGQQRKVTRKDLRGNVVSTDFPGGGSSTATYDHFGRMTASRDPKGLAVRIEYDTLGRVLLRQDTDTGVTRFTYDLNGNVLTKTDANGSVQRSTYDVLGRLISQADQPASASIRKAPDVRYRYDEGSAVFGRGRLTSMVMPEIGLEHRYVYDAQGNAVAQTTALRNTTYTVNSKFDPLGRVVETTLPDGSRVATDYNEGGQIKRRSLLSVNPSESETWASYDRYDPLGSPTTTKYSNGLVISKQYDAIGRPNRTVADGAGGTIVDTRYVWSTGNKLIAIIDQKDARRTQRFVFDSRGQLFGAQGIYGTQAYTYDDNGNITSKGGQIFLVPGGSNRLLASHNGRYLYQYDANGNRTMRADVNGSLDTYRYDTRNRLVEVSRQSITKPEPTIVAQYVYGAAGERLYKKEADGTETLYVGPSYEVTFAAGKRLHTRTLHGLEGPIATLTRDANAVALTTSADNALPRQGLLGAMTLSVSRSADTLSRHLKSITADLPAWPSLLTLAAMLLLLLQPCTGVAAALWYGTPLAAQFSGLSVSSIAHDVLARVTLLTFFVATALPASAATLPGANGVGVPEAGRLFFYQDHRDSTALVLNDQAAVVARIEYAPYGEIFQEASEGTDNFRPKFTGKELERDTGLYFYGARYMDPTSGRFISADPAREFASPYTYAANDPLLYIDPTGESVLAAALIAGTGLAYGYLAASKRNGTFNPVNWDWTNGSTYSKLILGFARGAVFAYGLTSTVGAYQTAKAAAAAAGKKVGKKVLVTTVAIVSTEVGLELLNLLSLKFDLEWLSKLTFGLQLGYFAFDLYGLVWNLPDMNFRLPKFSNPVDIQLPPIPSPNLHLPDVPLPDISIKKPDILPALKSIKMPDAPKMPEAPKVEIDDTVGLSAPALSIPKPTISEMAGALIASLAGGVVAARSGRARAIMLSAAGGTLLGFSRYFFRLVAYYWAIRRASNLVPTTRPGQA